MENLYNRIENLDEAIRSVKLPYMAWKVLFLVDKDTPISSITEILDANEDDVKSSIDVLKENGLITVAESNEILETEKENIAEDKEEETTIPEPEPEPEPEVEAEPEVVTEEKGNNLENEIDSAISDDTDFDLGLSDEESEITKEEPVMEDTASIEEVIEEPEIEVVDQEEEIPGEEMEDDENIEINISDEQAGSEVEEMEFNFNLTGDESDQEKITEPDQKPKATQQPMKEEPKAKSKPGSKQILVIDDSLVIRKMVEIALEEEDYNIVTAVSGKEGLEALDKNNPDLVILDMMLPDINGIEILKTIKASKGIPVIMLSGKDSPQMIETAKNEGAEEFLPKPFKDDDLVEKIKKLL